MAGSPFKVGWVVAGSPPFFNEVNQLSQMSAAARFRQAICWEANWEEQMISPAAGRSFSDSPRRQSGSFYTPIHLVNLLTSLALQPVLSEIRTATTLAIANHDKAEFTKWVIKATELRVCDPTCGSGRFLLTAFRWLRAFHIKLARQEEQLAGKQLYDDITAVAGTRALSCLYGYDTDKQALSCAYHVLSIAAGTSAHLSHLEIQDAATASFTADVVLGNPPWGAKGNVAKAAQSVGLPMPNANTFSNILYKAWHNLAPGGRLGFVLPRNFLKGHDYATVRRNLLTEGRLEWVIDAGCPFATVTQEAVLLVAHRQPPNNKDSLTTLARLTAAATPGERSATSGGRLYQHQVWKLTPLCRLDQHVFASNKTALITIHSNQAIFDLVQHMEETAPIKLRQMVSWQRGLEYGSAGLLTRCASCGEYASPPGKKRAHKECPTCGALLTEQIDYRLITNKPDERHCHPVYAGLHVNRYHLAAPAWLDPHVPGVKYKPQVNFATTKVLVPKIAPCIQAALDTSGAYTTQGVYLLWPRAKWDCWALLGWLNSAALSFYYEHRYNDQATLTTNVVLAHLLELPVPSIIPAHTQLWQQVAAAARLLHNHSSAQIIEQAEADLNKAVCALYDLPPRKIKMIIDWNLKQSSHHIEQSDTVCNRRSSHRIEQSDTVCDL